VTVRFTLKGLLANGFTIAAPALDPQTPSAGSGPGPVWTYVVWPNSVKFFGTHGLVKVKGTIDGHPFKSSFMAMGDGRHMLPVKIAIRRAIGKEVGEPVKVLLKQRIRTER
jgi:hypothetical protein